LNVSYSRRAKNFWLFQLSHCGPFVLFCRFPMDIIILVKLALKHELLEFNLLLKNNLINYNRIELLKKLY
jgi:hypothetical protein